MIEPKRKRKFKPKRLKHLSFKAMAPNMITVLALSAGAFAIRFALEGRFEEAIFAVFIAAILDVLDGGIARLLKATSRFGAELDSLSDVISFGVAPAFILYNWSLKSLGGLGWVLALAFMVSCALRLARFNSKLEDDEEPRRKAGLLTGLPAPVGAVLGLLPLMLSVEVGLDFFKNPEIVGFYTALICFGMVSKIPTYSYRSMRFRKDMMVPILLLVALMAAAAPTYGWWTLIAPATFYILSIPVGVYRFYKLTKPS